MMSGLKRYELHLPLGHAAGHRHQVQPEPIPRS